MAAPILGRTTMYRGIQMRSRLEARFAAGLDAQDLPWTYEPRCYASGRVQWLPDFETTYEGRTCLVEVKPEFRDWFDFTPRMEVAWETDPDLILMLWTPRDGWIGAHGQWFPMVYGHHYPDDEEVAQ